MSNTEKAWRPFLEHHARRVKNGEITNAIRNCHVKGLHSVMLHDEPGNRIRVFYTDPDHDLWHTVHDRMTLAIHPHHCDVTLVPLPFAVPYNYRYTASKEPGGFFLQQNENHSAISGGTGKLEPTMTSRWLQEYRDPFRPGCALTEPIFMPAKQLHTISVDRGQQCGWLVIEGAEDPDYDPICYTNNPVFDTTGLYERDPGVAVEVFKFLTPWMFRQ